MAYDVVPLTGDNCTGCGEPISMAERRIVRFLTKESWHVRCEHLIPEYTLPPDKTQAAIIQLDRELGIRPEGNMMWFLNEETAPRQLTKVERKLYKALVQERVKHNRLKE